MAQLKCPRLFLIPTSTSPTKLPILASRLRFIQFKLILRF